MRNKRLEEIIAEFRKQEEISLARYCDGLNRAHTELMREAMATFAKGDDSTAITLRKQANHMLTVVREVDEGRHASMDVWEAATRKAFLAQQLKDKRKKK